VQSRREVIRSLGQSIGALAVAGACTRWMNGCGTGARGTRVVGYISADDVLAREVLAACARATGVEVDAVYDTEATKTTALENRIRAERDRPRADFFWSSEGFAAVRLAADGLLAELPEPLWSAWPEAHRDGARRWLAFAARARVVVARKASAASASSASSVSSPAPIAQWSDLAASDRKVAGSGAAQSISIAIADPRFGTTNGHLAALEQAWGAAALDAWLDGLRANGVRVLPGGNAATVDAVAGGECTYGLTDSDDALAAIERGLPLEMFVPRTLAAGSAGGGTMLTPNTVSLIANAPGNRAAAEKVVAWLVSPECEELIARSPSRNLPLGPKARVAAAPFAEPDPLRFDVARASERAMQVAVAAKNRLEGKRA